MLYTWLRKLFRLFYRTIFRLDPVGLENIPLEGAVILCSNHKSNWDPPTVAVFLDRKVRFMAKSELFNIPLFGTLISKLGAFPVKRGKIGKSSVKQTLDILKQGEVLLIFPEGTRKNTNGIGKRGAASFALKANATIIPVAIVGSYRLFGKLKIIYGSPMKFQVEGRATPEQLDETTEQIMNRIRRLERDAASIHR